MSILADYLAQALSPVPVDERQKLDDTGSGQLAPPPPTDDGAVQDVERSPVRPTRFTPGPALDASSSRRPKSILKTSQEVGTTSSPVMARDQERSPVRANKRLTFAMDLARPFAEFGQPKPQPDALTTGLSPSGQRAVERYRSNVTRLLGSESPLVDKNHFHHLAPLIRVHHGGASGNTESIVRRPIDSLKESQVAVLDCRVQDHMAYCEQLLGIHSRQASTDGVGDKLAKQISEQRWNYHVQQEALSKAHSDNMHSSPAKRRQMEADKAAAQMPRFNLRSKATTEPHITGADVIRARREQREAVAALQRLAKDPEVQRQHRLIRTIEEVERRAEVYKTMIAEQDAAEEERQKGHVGNKLSPEELIAQWRLEVADRVETEEMEEDRERTRSYRRALRVEREEKRRAVEVLSGLTSVQLEDRRRRSEATKSAPGRRRWRITRMGSVDTFAIPRWSTCPQKTLNGDVVVEELDSCVINHVTWIHTTEGWIAVQVAFNGFSRTQLFAEVPEDQGDGVVNAMLDSLDEAHEKIMDAMTMCPPEQLKSQVEVKEQLKQMEFTRQSLRDLPDGRRDMIRRIWDSMQSGKKRMIQPPDNDGV
jgi:hypothetical protein